MPLSDDIRSLADQVLDRVDEAREFHVHSRQAWRLVQQLARKGRPVGIVDLATRRHLPTGDLESCRGDGCVAETPLKTANLSATQPSPLPVWINSR